MISFLIKDNENIRNFLEGKDDYIPTSEICYLHTHTLIRPNFSTEIQDLVEKVGEKIIAKNITGKPIDTLEELAIKIGQELSDGSLSNEGAKSVLFSLRRLYKLCNDLDKKL